MGEPELKIALQRDGEARIRGFWQDAEGAVEKQRAETRQELDLLREETDRVLQSESVVSGHEGKPVGSRIFNRKARLKPGRSANRGSRSATQSMQ